MASGLSQTSGSILQSVTVSAIKTISNLGYAWRSLAKKPFTESDKNSALVETNFNLVLKGTNTEEQQSKPTIVEMSTHEPPISMSTEFPRHFDFFARPD